MMNKCEKEIDDIRLKLYEETKNLTRDEDNNRLYELGQKLSLEFGFKITPDSDE
ncbi:MAG: hypothetical protein FWH14_06905 [Oscillospiraceae bacterium]|nr:hypothetical protein [Oscillospiraceae bacterium]